MGLIEEEEKVLGRGMRKEECIEFWGYRVVGVICFVFYFDVGIYIIYF